MTLRSNPAAAERMLKILGNGTCEIRALGSGQPLNGYFGDPASAAQAACEINEAHGLRNVYVTVNEIREGYRESYSEKLEGGTAVKANDIIRLRHLVSDIDPLKPKGVTDPATESEHAASYAVRRQLKQHLTSRGWPLPVEMSSGNGCYLIYRIDLPNNTEHVELIRRVLASLGNLYDSKDAKVDRNVHDPGRVFRLAGTINRKGDESSERPYRVASLISVPEGDDLKPVSEEQLREIASNEIESQKNKPMWYQALAKASPAERDKRVEALTTFLKNHDRVPVSISEEERFTKIDLPYCTRGAEHADGNPAVFVRPDGTIGYHCFHTKCSHIGWHEFQEALGSTFEDPVFGGIVALAYDNPRMLAHRFLQGFRAPDDAYKIAHFLCDTYRFYDTVGWRKLKPGELNAEVRGSIQEAFDEHARSTGKGALAKPVKSALVGDTFGAIQTICSQDVAPDFQVPFWFEKQTSWAPEDLLVLQNGLLDIRKYVQGDREVLRPITPKLFFQHRAKFDFDPNAPQPSAWHSFLNTLKQDEDWIACLQEIMGYCLWLGFDVQKYFMLIGPPRSGKETITRVLTDLLGGAVCSPNLEDFVKEFGLEQALGKRLAIVPEAVSPGRNEDKIVSQLKAITGGDQITVNVKHRANLSLQLRLKILMQTNDFIALPDTSGALLTRLIPLRLTESFRGAEDINLSSKLAEEYPGILSWSLEGLKRLHEKEGRFTLPQSSKNELEQLQDASSPLLRFVQDCCLLDSREGVETTALHKIFLSWREQNNDEVPEMNKSAFNTSLRTTVPKISSCRAGSRNPGDFSIVQTKHDTTTLRPQVWKGIRPNPEWCTSA